MIAPSTCMLWWKPICSMFLKLYSWRFRSTLIFHPNRQSITSLWHHLRPTYQDLEKILWFSMCKNNKGRVNKVWQRYLLPVFKLPKDKWMGPFRAPPPPSPHGSRVRTQCKKNMTLQADSTVDVTIRFLIFSDPVALQQRAATLMSLSRGTPTISGLYINAHSSQYDTAVPLTITCFRRKVCGNPGKWNAEHAAASRD